MAGQEMANLNTSSSTQPVTVSNSRSAAISPSHPSNTSTPTVFQVLNDGRLTQGELTRRQRRAIRLNEAPPQLTSEQLKIVKDRKTEGVVSQEQDTMALGELQSLIAEGSIDREHLTSGQLTALRLGSAPPALSEGQRKMINASQLCKAERATKERQRLEQETRPMTDKSDIYALGGMGAPHATLRKLVDDGLIMTSELSAKQRRALDNGWQAPVLGRDQLNTMARRLEKTKAQKQKGTTEASGSAQVADNMTENTASAATVHPKASPLHANILKPSEASLGDPAACKTFASSSVQTRFMSQATSSHTEVPRSSQTTITSSSPTDQYMQQASAKPIRLKSPQPLLIIADLNGTLLNRKKRTKSNPGAFRARPGLHSFLCYVLNLDIPTTNPYERVPRTTGKDFSFMVWTSARPENAKLAVETLFTPSTAAKVKAVWARDKLGLSKKQYYEKVQVYKTLQTVWSDPQVQSWHPNFEEGGSWNQSNTVLIDDSPIKAATEPYNHIQVPELDNARLAKEADAFRKAEAKPGTTAWDDPHDWRAKEKARRAPRGVLACVAEYLDQARWYNDVSAYMRSNKFKMPDSDAEEEVKAKDAEMEESSVSTGAAAALEHLDIGEDVLDVLMEDEDGGVTISDSGNGGVQIGKGKGKKA